MSFTSKIQLLAFSFFLCSLNVFSQTHYEKGVFITNNDEKVECFIKNIDWKNNPTDFKYRLTEEGEIKTEYIESVKVFEIYGVSKFLRAVVNIDRSTSNINNLTTSKNPIFIEEQLFLKILVSGKATLYYYEDGNLKRFFYSIGNGQIEQLVYKEYQFDVNNVGENNHYKQQLLNSLKGDDISLKSVKNIDYNIEDLTSLFEEYNISKGQENVINYEKKNKKDLFNVRAKVGFGSSSLSIYNSINSYRDAKFDNEMSYRFGGELEMILPFNNSKWALVVEPSYQSYESKKKVPSTIVVGPNNYYNYQTNYSRIEIPLGIRYYVFLNDESKVFVNGFYSLIYTDNSYIDTGNGTVLELENASGKSIGIGYNYKKLSLECRYEFTRDVFVTYKTWNSDYNQVAFIFGYQLF